MPAVMKTPGVYIVEKNAFPNSVVAVPTAVPCFIGYTEKADNKGTSLYRKPWKIGSMAEFVNYFGGPPPATFHVTLGSGAAPPAAGAPSGSSDQEDLTAAEASAKQKALDAIKSLADQTKSASDSAQSATAKATAAKAASDAVAKLQSDTAGAADFNAILSTAKQTSDQAKTDADAAVKAAQADPNDAGKATDAANKTATATALDNAVRTVAAAIATELGRFANPFAQPITAAAPPAPTTTAAVATVTGPGAATAPQTPAAPAPFSFANYTVTRSPTEQKFLLYYSMLFFYQNGGGPCYILSVGKYSNQEIKVADFIGDDKTSSAIDLLLKEQEPTMIVTPDSVRLSRADWKVVQTTALAHCAKTQSRITIVDVYDGFKDRRDPPTDCVTDFRGDIGLNFLNYGTAYYPWLNTSITSSSDIGYLNFDPDDLKAIISAEGQVAATQADGKTASPIFDAFARLQNVRTKADINDDNQPYIDLLNKSLLVASPAYGRLVDTVQQELNLLPPAAAMAGVYTMVDNTRGVWKAPANLSLNSVVSPTVNITYDDQEDLNVDMIAGKSINAIRTFIGEGVLVWGARTLDGNSLDWRYISVRRTMIFLEQSIKLAAKAYVFENNVSTTWVTIKSMIRNFLNGIWKQGGLAGASPDDAFAVFCGLGETMTSEDILEGILRITVLVAITRPAEFIEITFQQQMQKS